MKKSILLMTIFFSISLYVNAQKKNSFYEILPLIINSTLDNEILSIPPPPLSIEELKRKKYFEKSDPENLNKAISNWKKSKGYRKILSRWKKNLKNLVPKTYDGYLYLFKEVQTNHEKNELLKHFKNGIKDTVLNTENSFNIELKKINTNKIRTQLKVINKLMKIENLRKENYDKKITGIMLFHNLNFDNSQKFGVIDISFSKNKLSGYGLRVYLKKKKTKWKVDEVINLWVK